MTQTWAACVRWSWPPQRDWSRSSGSGCRSAGTHAPEPAWAENTHTHTHWLTHSQQDVHMQDLSMDLDEEPVSTMFSLISSFCVIWMSVWKSRPWCWMRISQVSPYPPCRQEEEEEEEESLNNRTQEEVKGEKAMRRSPAHRDPEEWFHFCRPRIWHLERAGSVLCLFVRGCREKTTHYNKTKGILGEYYTLTWELITIMTTPAGEIKRSGSRDVWPVDVSSTVQKTQHRLKGK